MKRKAIFIKQNISLPKNQAEYVKRVAKERGHHNFSRVIQDILFEHIGSETAKKEAAK